MAIMTSALGEVFDILRAVISRQLADEVKEWVPWLTERLVQRAVAKLPENSRQRYKEEWHSHLDSLPGGTAKVLNALDFYSGARRMGSAGLSPRDIGTFPNVLAESLASARVESFYFS